MKKQILFSLLLSLFLFTKTNAQTWNGDLSLRSQLEVDLFIYTEVTGNLLIQELSFGNITNLNGLSELASVGGNFTIQNNAALANMDGLSGLTSIGGSLIIFQNINLANINSFSSLSSIGLDLYFSENRDLTNIDGLDHLISVGRNLEISRNYSLEDIDGLSNLSSILGNTIRIEENLGLTNVDFLSNLTTATNILIYSNQLLDDIDGLSNLTSVGLLDINDNRDLDYISLPELTSVEEINIRNNYILTGINLPSLTSIAGLLQIYDNDALISIELSSELDSIAGSLQINDNDALASIELPQLYSIGGSLAIADNNALYDIGLTNLISIGDYFSLDYNTSLSNLNGFSNLESVGNGISIASNTALTTIIGLSNLTHVGTSLNIYNNIHLTNIDGLNGITSLGGYLEIYYNDSLENIDGLIGLTTISDRISIYENDALLNINGLSNLTSAVSLSFYNNDALAEFCGLYTLFNNGYSGYYDFVGNATNPTPQEIIDGGPCDNIPDPCDITGASFGNISSCNNNGTPGNASDDFYTADLTINFTNPPATGTLRIQPDNPNVLDVVEVAVGSLVGNSHTFTGVRLRATGGTFGVTVEFSDDNACTGTIIAPAVSSCAATDNTPPNVISTSPPHGAMGVSVNTTVIANFNEAVNPATVTTSTFELKISGTAIPATVSTAGSQITLTPSSPLTAGTLYTAVITGGSSGVKDLAGNALVNHYSWQFTTAAAPVTTYTIFSPTSSGQNQFAQPREVGVKFRVTQAGYITGIRFYKTTANTGTHTGHLWSNTGTSLASVTFTGETASGWQQALFASPVAVTPGVTYIASYFTPTGNHAITTNFFTSAVVNGPLRALASSEDGGNGLFKNSASPVFPNTASSLKSNFWVDVVFTTGMNVKLMTQQSSLQPADEETSTQKLTVKVTPNPSENFFKLIVMSDDDKAPIGVRIMDISGRVLEHYEKVTAGSLLQVGGSLRGGTYFAEVVQGDQRRVVKIMKVN